MKSSTPYTHTDCAPLLPLLHRVWLQFWVYSLYNAFRSGQAGVRPLSGAQLAAESSRGGGQYQCVPNKIKF